MEWASTKEANADMSGKMTKPPALLLYFMGAGGLTSHRYWEKYGQALLSPKPKCFGQVDSFFRFILLGQ